MEDVKTSLYIPANIRPRLEFFDGFGVAELIATIMAALVSGFFAFIIYALTGSLISAVLCVLVTVTASVMAQIKDASNQSVIDQIKYVLRFLLGQKAYPYFYVSDFIERTGRKKIDIGYSQAKEKRPKRHKKQGTAINRKRVY
jgi:hypothetical protein